MKGKIILAAMLLTNIIGTSREAMAAGNNLRITNKLSDDFNYSVYNASIATENITGVVKTMTTATIALPSSLQSSNGYVMIQFWKTGIGRTSTDLSSLITRLTKDTSGNYGITFTSLTNVNVQSQKMSYPAVAIDSNQTSLYTQSTAINPSKTLLMPLSPALAPAAPTHSPAAPTPSRAAPTPSRAAPTPSITLTLPQGFTIKLIGFCNDSICQSIGYFYDYKVNQNTVTIPLSHVVQNNGKTLNMSCKRLRVTLSMGGVTDAGLWESNVEAGKAYSINKDEAKSAMIAKLTEMLKMLENMPDKMRPQIQTQITTIESQIKQINAL